MKLQRNKKIIITFLIMFLVFSTGTQRSVCAEERARHTLAAPVDAAKNVDTIKRNVRSNGRLLALVPLIIGAMFACEPDLGYDEAKGPRTINGNVFSEEIVDFKEGDNTDYATIEHRRNGILYMTTWITYKKGTKEPINGISYPMTEDPKTGEAVQAFSGAGWKYYLESEKIRNPEFYEKYMKGFEKINMTEDSSDTTRLAERKDTTVTASNQTARESDLRSAEVNDTVDFKESLAFFKQTLRKARNDSLIVPLADSTTMKLYYETVKVAALDSMQRRVFLMERRVSDTIAATFAMRYRDNGVLGQIVMSTPAGERIVVQGNSIYEELYIYYQQSSIMPIRAFALTGGKVKPLSGKGPSKSLAKKLRHFAYTAFQYSGINTGEIVVLRSA
jgi:hypothetical protein